MCPAVLETILRSEAYSSIDKYQIADYLGVFLPQGIVYPQIRNITYSDSTKDYGVKLKQATINDFFKHFNIKLIENYVTISQIDRDFFTDVIVEILKKESHIICGFEYNSLYHQDRDEYVGHVSIIISADPVSEAVTLLDPGPKDHGIKKISSYELYKSINRAHDGLWIISRIKE